MAIGFLFASTFSEYESSFLIFAVEFPSEHSSVKHARAHAEHFHYLLGLALWGWLFPVKQVVPFCRYYVTVLSYLLQQFFLVCPYVVERTEFAFAVYCIVLFHTAYLLFGCFTYLCVVLQLR